MAAGLHQERYPEHIKIRRYWLRLDCNECSSRFVCSFLHDVISAFGVSKMELFPVTTSLKTVFFFIPVVLTSSPKNEAELQLYRVMQRASLLAYYDTLLEMGKHRDSWRHAGHGRHGFDFFSFFFISGGDDVQQLCDAGEEEFLEIMALVGMASKPLHVRRLQKALQEWVSNPGE